MRTPVQQILLVRYLYEKGVDSLREQTEASVGLAVSLFQDAVELLARTVAKEIEADLPEKSSFAEIWDKVAKAPNNSEGTTLPLKAKMADLNKARVNFKHYGILPGLGEGNRFEAHTQDFLAETVTRFFQTDFLSVSLSDLLREKNVRTHVKAAEKALAAGDNRLAVEQAAFAEAFVNNAMGQLVPNVPFGLEGLVGTQESSELGKLKEVIRSLRSFTIATALHLPVSDVVRYPLIAPYAALIGGSPEVLSLIADEISDEDAAFVVQHVTKLGLAVERLVGGGNFDLVIPFI